MAHITPAHVDRLHSTLSGLDEVRSDVLGGILRDANIVSPDDRRQLIDELVRVKALVPLSTNEHQQVTYRVNVSDRGATVVNTQPLQVIEQEAVQQLRTHAGKRLQTFQLAAILVAAGATTPELRGIATHRLIKRGVVQETVDGDRKSYIVVGAAAQTAATVRVTPSVSEIGVLTMRKITVPGSDTVRADVLGGALQAAGASSAEMRATVTRHLISSGHLRVLSTNEHGQTTYTISTAASQPVKAPGSVAVATVVNRAVIALAGKSTIVGDTLGNLLRELGAKDPLDRQDALAALVNAGHVTQVGRNAIGQQIYEVRGVPVTAGTAAVGVPSVAARTTGDALREAALPDGKITGAALGAALSTCGIATTMERREATERLVQEGLLARLPNDAHGHPVFQLASVSAIPNEKKNRALTAAFTDSETIDGVVSSLSGRATILERDLDALLQRHGAVSAKQRAEVLQRLVDAGLVTPWAELNDDGEAERKVLTPAAPKVATNRDLNGHHGQPLAAAPPQPTAADVTPLLPALHSLEGEVLYGLEMTFMLTALQRNVTGPKVTISELVRQDLLQHLPGKQLRVLAVPPSLRTALHARSQLPQLEFTAAVEALRQHLFRKPVPTIQTSGLRVAMIAVSGLLDQTTQAAARDALLAQGAISLSPGGTEYHITRRTETTTTASASGAARNGGSAALVAAHVPTPCATAPGTERRPAGTFADAGPNPLRQDLPQRASDTATPEAAPRSSAPTLQPNRPPNIFELRRNTTTTQAPAVLQAETTTAPGASAGALLAPLSAPEQEQARNLSLHFSPWFHDDTPPLSSAVPSETPASASSLPPALPPHEAPPSSIVASAPQSVVHDVEAHKLRSVAARLQDYAPRGVIRGSDLGVCQIAAGISDAAERKRITQALVQAGHLAEPVPDEYKLPVYRVLAQDSHVEVNKAPTVKVQAASTTDVEEVARRVVSALCGQQQQDEVSELREDTLGSLLRDVGATDPEVRKEAKRLLIQKAVIAPLSVNAHGQTTFWVTSASRPRPAGSIPAAAAAASLRNVNAPPFDMNDVAQRVIASLSTRGVPTVRDDVLGVVMSKCGATLPGERNAVKALLLERSVVVPQSVNEHGQTTFAVTSCGSVDAIPKPAVSLPRATATADADEVVRQVTDSLSSLPAGAKLREDLLGSLLCNSGAVQADVRKSAKALLIQQGVITPMSVNSHGQTTFAIASASGQPTSYIAGATPSKGLALRHRLARRMT
jgi:hypothetical protein